MNLPVSVFSCSSAGKDSKDQQQTRRHCARQRRGSENLAHQPPSGTEPEYSTSGAIDTTHTRMSQRVRREPGEDHMKDEVLVKIEKEADGLTAIHPYVEASDDPLAVNPDIDNIKEECICAGTSSGALNDATQGTGMSQRVKREPEDQMKAEILVKIEKEADGLTAIHPSVAVSDDLPSANPDIDMPMNIKEECVGASTSPSAPNDDLPSANPDVDMSVDIKEECIGTSTSSSVSNGETPQPEQSSAASGQLLERDEEDPDSTRPRLEASFRASETSAESDPPAGSVQILGTDEDELDPKRPRLEEDILLSGGGGSHQLAHAAAEGTRDMAISHPARQRSTQAGNGYTGVGAAASPRNGSGPTNSGTATATNRELVLPPPTGNRAVIAMASRVNAVEVNQVKALESLQKPSETLSATSTVMTEQLLSSARSIADIQSATNKQIRGDPEKKALHCIACISDLTEQVMKLNRVDGVFHYDFSLGTSFAKSEKMPKAFANLKMLVKKHLTSKSHRRHMERATEKAAASAERKADSKSVSIRVLREAFKVLKFSLAHVHFELNVVSHHRNNVDMGDIGHSAAQMNRFREVFWAEVMTGVQRFIARQPCVSLVADSATVNHRTFDITAVLCVVPEAPVKELVQSFVIAAPVVKNHGGQAIAEEWKRSLAKVGVTRPEQLASMCTDGRYHSIGAPKKLLDLMRCAQEDIREQSRPTAVPVIWDTANLVELAESSARKEPTCSWVEEVKQDISRISQRFTTASGWERLQNAGKKLGVKTLRPRSCSDTSFAPHVAAVVDAFVNNITAMKAALDKQLASPETKTSLRSELEVDVRLLGDLRFNNRLAALLDIYSIIGECSRALQNVQLLPWERQEARQRLVKTLTAQKEVLDVLRRVPQRHKKSLTPSEIHSHPLEPDPSDMSKWWPTLGKKAATLGPKQAAEVSAFVAALHDHFKKRERGVDARANTRGCQNTSLNTWMEDIRTVGDLERLSASPSSSIADDVQTAIVRLQRGGCIPTSEDVPILGIVKAYRVVRELRMNRGTTDNRLLFKTLYQHSQDDRELRPLINVIIRLLLVWPPESEVESMAGVIGDIFGTRRQLSHQNAAKELIVRWNSPDVFAADDLIEAVQDRHNFQFVRRTTDTRSAFHGTVIGRHLRPDLPDRRASVFRRH